MPGEHHRNLHDQISVIRIRLLEMGAQVETMLATAARALVERDETLIDEVITQDNRVDRLEVEIDDECHSALARNQPTAIDMRFLVAAMKITADLERIADSAVNIAQAAHQLNAEAPLLPYVDLPEMARRAQQMVHDALDSFMERDAALAREVCARDDEIDRLYHGVFAEMVDRMGSEAGAVRPAVHLLLVARNLERIADHATNIAEDVVYYVEAVDIRHGGAHAVVPSPGGRTP